MQEKDANNKKLSFAFYRGGKAFDTVPGEVM